MQTLILENIFCGPAVLALRVEDEALHVLTDAHGERALGAFAQPGLSCAGVDRLGPAAKHRRSKHQHLIP
ncbi:MAG: hypothetical protein ACK56I_14475, partial [bacterium]